MKEGGEHSLPPRVGGVKDSRTGTTLGVLPVMSSGQSSSSSEERSSSMVPAALKAVLIASSDLVVAVIAVVADSPRFSLFADRRAMTDSTAPIVA